MAIVTQATTDDQRECVASGPGADPLAAVGVSGRSFLRAAGVTGAVLALPGAVSGCRAAVVAVAAPSRSATSRRRRDPWPGSARPTTTSSAACGKYSSRSSAACRHMSLLDLL
jgi:hypothetical protein